MTGRNPFRTTSSCGCGGGSATTRSACETRRIKSISRVKDEVIIAFDDCTYIQAPLDVVDASVTGSVPPTDTCCDKIASIEARLSALETNKGNSNGIEGSLVDVHNTFGDKVVFKAFCPTTDTKPTGEGAKSDDSKTDNSDTGSINKDTDEPAKPFIPTVPSIPAIPDPVNGGESSLVDSD